MKHRYQWRRQREPAAFLALADGTVYHGHSFGAKLDREGEVVFNTGMTGYQEILTDPSYAGQFVTMTYPEIGNTGINPADMESRQAFLNGFIVHELNPPENWRAAETLDDFLRRSGIPAIAGIDTRALTTKLRTEGTMKAFLGTTGRVSPTAGVARARAWEGLDNQDYAARVSCPRPYRWDPTGKLTASWGITEQLPKAEYRVVAYDFGIKWNILRQLRLQGMDVTVVPAKTTAAKVLAMKPDGVFLSNGPADPLAVSYAIKASQELLGKVPLMGICLGHQILGLACGFNRFRLKFGHHGCNHPVKRLATGTVEITSQNHNFGIAAESCPAHVEITHINLNDQTVEGIRHRREPMFAVQYHPEAAPGPHDPRYIFDLFKAMMGR